MGFGIVKFLVVREGKQAKVEGGRLKEFFFEQWVIEYLNGQIDNENYIFFHTKNKPQTLFNIQGMKSNTIINQNQSFYPIPFHSTFNILTNLNLDICMNQFQIHVQLQFPCIFMHKYIYIYIYNFKSELQTISNPIDISNFNLNPLNFLV